MPEAGTRPIYLQIVACTVFCTFNITLNEFNQWALNKNHWPGFDFPIFYTMFHMLASAVVAFILTACVVKPENGLPSLSQFWEYKNALVPMGICTFLSNGLNNASLGMVSLFLNQAVKACLPMPIMLFSCLLAGKRYGMIRIATVLGICAGSVLAISYRLNSGGNSDAWLGITLVVISVIACALRPTIAMIVMDGSNGKKLEPTVVMTYDSGMAFLCMLITWLVNSAEREESLNYLANSQTMVIGIVVLGVGTVLAIIFNLANFYFIKLTSALTTSIGGSGVKIILLLVSAVQAHVRDVLSWVGVAIVVISIMWYTYDSLPPGALSKTPPAPEQSPEADGATRTNGASASGKSEKTPLVQP